MGKKAEALSLIGIQNTLTDTGAAIAELEAGGNIAAFQLWCREAIADGAKPDESDLDTLVSLFTRLYLIKCERQLMRTCDEVAEMGRVAGLIPDRPNARFAHLIRAKLLVAFAEDTSWDSVLAHHAMWHAERADPQPSPEE